jgi:hypothetical protein
MGADLKTANEEGYEAIHFAAMHGTFICNPNFNTLVSLLIMSPRFCQHSPVSDS